MINDKIWKLIKSTRYKLQLYKNELDKREEGAHKHSYVLGQINALEQILFDIEFYTKDIPRVE